MSRIGVGVLFLSTLAGAVPESLRVLDDKALNGTWIPVSAELATMAFPKEALEFKLIIKDGTYTFISPTEGEDKGTAETDATKTPATMDIKGTDGPNKGKTFLAIYEVKGDVVKVCYDLSGQERPTEFKTKPDTTQFLVEYRREK